MIGDGDSAEENFPRSAARRAGDMSLRVVATLPATADCFAWTNFVSALARKRLWLTDAYYAAPRPMCKVLGQQRRMVLTCGFWCRTERTFRCLRPLSRAGYRPLLEAGVRVFEWNGTMLHAKTAVADGRWARVGSYEPQYRELAWKLRIGCGNRG